MQYMTIKEASQKWNVSIRRINKLLNEGRIEGAYKTTASWNIPIDTEKPIDKRYKKEEKIIINLDQHYFNELDKKKKLLDSKRPFPEHTLKSLQEDLFLRWTYNSNAIEGNTLTLIETKVVLEGITVGGKSVREHLEATNHQDAIYFLMDLIKEKETLSEINIKNIHQLVLKEVDNKNAGVYRNQNVIIPGAKHIPPEHFKVKELMERMLNDYQNWEKYHPIARAAILHVIFVKIHPFVDGNGRTSRLLMNFEAIKNGYPPIVIKLEQRAKYFAALDKAHTKGDYTDFIKIVAEAALDSIETYLKIIA